MALYHKPIEGDEPIVLFFNKILDEIKIIRMTSAPSNTFIFDYFEPSTALTYYQCCLVETYFKSIIKNLREWSNDSKTYIEYCGGEWKDFAEAERAKLYENYVDDYYEELNKELTDKELWEYNISNRWFDFNDIFLTSKPDDFIFIYELLEHTSIFSFSNLKKALDVNLKTFKIENGKIREMTFGEEITNEIEKEHKIDSLTETLRKVIMEIYYIRTDAEQLPIMENNKEFYKQLPNRINELFNLKF